MAHRNIHIGVYKPTYSCGESSIPVKESKFELVGPFYQRKKQTVNLGYLSSTNHQFLLVN
jgi:hypothetical protein